MSQKQLGPANNLKVPESPAIMLFGHREATLIRNEQSKDDAADVLAKALASFWEPTFGQAFSIIAGRSFTFKRDHVMVEALVRNSNEVTGVKTMKSESLSASMGVRPVVLVVMHVGNKSKMMALDARTPDDVKVEFFGVMRMLMQALKVPHNLLNYQNEIENTNPGYPGAIDVGTAT